MLHAVAELAEHLAGHVVRHLRHEEDADALRADQPDRLRDRLEERLGRAVEEQVRLVEEEDELRLVEVAGLGQLLEQLGDQPHERRREEPRLVLHGRQLEAGDDAAAVRGGADEVGDVELGLAEELVAAARLEPDEAAQKHADGRGREPADPLELFLARVRLEEGEQRPQVGQVEQRQALLVRVMEDEREALLLRLVRVEDLGEQLRAEVGDGRPHRHAGADPAEREVLDREPARLEREAELAACASRRGRRARPGRRARRRRP